MMFDIFRGHSRKGYTHVRSTEGEELKMGLLNGKLQEIPEYTTRTIEMGQRPSRISWRSKVVLLLYAVLTIANLTAFVGFMATTQLRWRGLGTRNWHQRMTSMHSPLFDVMDVDLQDIQWEGNLFNNKTSSIYRQPPSPEVDLAWAEIGDIKTFLVDRVDIERIGKDPENTVRAPASWGVGEKWIAQFDGPHQLHCLDVLRRQLYRDYYFGPRGDDGHPLYWTHITHCLDIVRQSLMCTSSVDLITFNFMETAAGPQYDFGVNHRCRNHQAILDWADAHEVDWEKNGFIGRPDGYPTVPTEEGYYAAVPALRAYNKAHGISSPTVPPPVPPGTNHQHGHTHPAYAESHHT